MDHELHPLARILHDNGWSGTDYLRRVAARHQARGFGVMPVDKKRVSRWINRGTVPEWTAQLAMADLHHVPTQHLYDHPWPAWLACVGHDDAALLDPTWCTAHTIDILDKTAGGLMDRRDFLVIGALGAITAQWTGAPPAEASSHGNGRRVGTAVASLHETRLEALRLLDDQVGSGEVHAAARTELRMITDTLAHASYTQDTGRRLYAAAAEAARICGWTAYDSGRHAQAQHFYVAALRAAASAGDEIVGANTLAFWAIQHYSTGDPRGAIHLVEAALGKAPAIGSPRMTAMLHARLARAHAKAGDKNASDRAAGAAFDAYDRIREGDDPEPGCVYWVNRGELHQLAGSSALNLNDPARALRHFQTAPATTHHRDAYDDTAFPRGAVIYLAREAEARLALADVDGAVDTARRALDHMGGVTSARGSTTLTDLRTRLAHHSKVPLVQEFLASTA
ncbi:transcriptional regulator [Embleya sp. MST-111070]|uniref:transcriptional regulator n=1 Tax=Embleya sp. MST-111070 TaxID=3398231 RepID=UPI003F73FF9D